MTTKVMISVFEGNHSMRVDVFEQNAPENVLVKSVVVPVNGCHHEYLWSNRFLTISEIEQTQDEKVTD